MKVFQNGKHFTNFFFIKKTNREIPKHFAFIRRSLSFCIYYSMVQNFFIVPCDASSYGTKIFLRTMRWVFIVPNRNFAAPNGRKILLVATRHRDQWNFSRAMDSKHRATKMLRFGAEACRQSPLRSNANGQMRVKHIGRMKQRQRKKHEMNMKDYPSYVTTLNPCILQGKWNIESIFWKDKIEWCFWVLPSLNNKRCFTPQSWWRMFTNQQNPGIIEQ
jgi:hypothetical protein